MKRGKQSFYKSNIETECLKSAHKSRYAKTPLWNPHSDNWNTEELDPHGRHSLFSHPLTSSLLCWGLSSSHLDGNSSWPLPFPVSQFSRLSHFKVNSPAGLSQHFNLSCISNHPSHPTAGLPRGLNTCIKKGGSVLTISYSPSHTLSPADTAALTPQSAYPVAQMIKNPPAMQETWVWSLDWEDPLEKGTAPQSSILAWKIPWTEESGRLQSTGSQRVGHDWATFTSLNSSGPGKGRGRSLTDQHCSIVLASPPHGKSWLFLSLILSASSLETSLLETAPRGD